MKYIITILALCLLTVIHAQACDVCGCSLGGNYYGILPMYNKNFIGVRWSQARFHSYIHDSNYLPAQYSNDSYSKLELWGRVYVTKRLQLFGFVPYVYNNMNGSDQVVSASGFGDVTLMSNYTLLNSRDDKTKLIKHTLMIGGGLKLPVGKFSLKDKGMIINRNFQMGTGSTDFLITSVYTIRYKKVGANAEAGYKINTRNKYDYLFGNQFHASTQFFYWQNAKAFTLLPNAGLYYETAAKHLDGDIIQANTGGSLLLATAGLETYYKFFTFGVNYKHPLTQHFNSDDTADITSKDRWTLSLTYNF